MNHDTDFLNLTLYERAEALKNMLVAYATTSNSGDLLLYRHARKELMNDTHLKMLMPQFLRTCRDTNEFWQFIKGKLRSYAERREFLRAEFDPLLSYLENGANSPIAHSADLALQTMSEDGVKDAWQRMMQRRGSDPEGAITAARTLVETVCKHVLDDLGERYDDGAELSALYKVVAAKLNLAPDQHTEQAFKQILSGCHSIVNGLASVRNKLSDAHGKGKRGARPSPRHAELAVNVSGALGAFLVATWEHRKG